ncbi:MAG: hypothetical protein WCF16_11670 [Alphaproteobacteria bacterium]
MSAARRDSLGVVTGLLAEAECLRRARAWTPDDRPTTFCSGGSAERARLGADALIAAGASALLSFGIAGGLDPALRPGAVVVASEVVTPQGRRIATDFAWREATARALAGVVPAVVAPIAGTDRPLVTPADKAKLRGSSGAAVVDMESHAVAEAAAARSLPFLAVRAIGDPAHRSVPQSALAGLGPGGETLVLPVLVAVLRRPWEWPALICVGIESAAGLRALRRVAQAGGAAFFRG